MPKLLFLPSSGNFYLLFKQLFVCVKNELGLYTVVVVFAGLFSASGACSLVCERGIIPSTPTYPPLLVLVKDADYLQPFTLLSNPDLILV